VPRQILIPAKNGPISLLSIVSTAVRRANLANWTGPADIKARYPSASFLDDNRVIFNIKGNTYRIETKVSYEITVVLIKRVGTHAKYFKWS
jgi:mRNA interferase HigB